MTWKVVPIPIPFPVVIDTLISAKGFLLIMISIIFTIIRTAGVTVKDL